MVKYGVTTVSDFFYVHNGGTANDEAVIRAAKDVGIRFVMARTMYDWTGAPQSYIESIDDAVTRTRQLAIKYQGDRMVDIHPAPHSPHAASPEMIQAGHKLAKELGTPFHIHVAEEMFEVNEILATYKKRPVHYLDSLGVVDDRMIAIHLVWIDESEVTLLGQRGSGLAYCPSSNMFLSDGVTPIPALAGAGVPIALGSTVHAVITELVFSKKCGCVHYFKKSTDSTAHASMPNKSLTWEPKQAPIYSD